MGGFKEQKITIKSEILEEDMGKKIRSQEKKEDGCGKAQEIRKSPVRLARSCSGEEASGGASLPRLGGVEKASLPSPLQVRPVGGPDARRQREATPTASKSGSWADQKRGPGQREATPYALKPGSLSVAQRGAEGQGGEGSGSNSAVTNSPNWADSPSPIVGEKDELVEEEWETVPQKGANKTRRRKTPPPEAASYAAAAQPSQKNENEKKKVYKRNKMDLSFTVQLKDGMDEKELRSDIGKSIGYKDVRRFVKGPNRCYEITVSSREKYDRVGYDLYISGKYSVEHCEPPTIALKIEWTSNLIGDEELKDELEKYCEISKIHGITHERDQEFSCPTGVRVVMIRRDTIKKDIPQKIRIGPKSLLLTYQGQERRCFNCNKPGHLSRQCKEKKKKERRKEIHEIMIFEPKKWKNISDPELMMEVGSTESESDTENIEHQNERKRKIKENQTKEKEQMEENKENTRRKLSYRENKSTEERETEEEESEDDVFYSQAAHYVDCLYQEEINRMKTESAPPDLEKNFKRTSRGSSDQSTPYPPTKTRSKTRKNNSNNSPTL